MDEYGFAAAMRAGAEVFEMSGRQSGRTMRMLERATDGDRIVTTNAQEANRLRGILKEMDKEVRVVAVDPDRPSLERLPTLSDGRTWFDHLWQKVFFDRALERAEHDLEQIQSATSKTWPQPNAEPVDDRGLSQQVRSRFYR